VRQESQYKHIFGTNNSHYKAVLQFDIRARVSVAIDNVSISMLVAQPSAESAQRTNGVISIKTLTIRPKLEVERVRGVADKGR